MLWQSLGCSDNWDGCWNNCDGSTTEDTFLGPVVCSENETSSDSEEITLDNKECMTGGSFSIDLEHYTRAELYTFLEAWSVKTEAEILSEYAGIDWDDDDNAPPPGGSALLKYVCVCVCVCDCVCVYVCVYVYVSV